MVTSKVLEDVIPQDAKFTGEEGLFVAAALTEYNDETEPIDDDPYYGKLVFKQRMWDTRKGSISSRDEELKSDYCTDADLGLVTDESAEV